jgi:predicted choloylglycine hydrolase
MTDNYQILEGTFDHLLLNGSSAEIGHQLAASMLSKRPYPNFITSGQVDAEKLGYSSFKQLEDSFERACPGIIDEIHGFAAAGNVRLEQIIFYQMSSLVLTNCSQMVALPAVTRDRHVLVGRSYEWKPEEDDLCLCTTAVIGKSRHIGFSCLFFGRMDGMNEHGLRSPTAALVLTIAKDSAPSGRRSPT